MSRQPFFSVVIPTYNRAALVGKTISTILDQQFTDFELIIVDDGSKDNTEEVVRSFNDMRLTYFKKENGERGAARNFGAQKANGVYVNFFDSDDLMYPHHLSTARDFIQQRGQPEFFHLGYDFKDANGNVTKVVNGLDESIAERALFDNFLSCNGVFVRMDIARKFPFDENRVLASAEDWELWIRLISRFKLHYSNAVTTSVVGHDERSIRTIPTDKVLNRDLYLIERLRSDPAVVAKFGRSFNLFVAQRYTFFMLCLADDRRRPDVIRWARRAVATYPLILFSPRFIASLKKTLLNG
ncbi:MAG TPA: glycosyltransferase [Chryseosolibacter sp.]|nr:glycosyltransferase [Chryseosolibacter sp.]